MPPIESRIPAKQAIRVTTDAIDDIRTESSAIFSRKKMKDASSILSAA